jgi:predicted permease
MTESLLISFLGGALGLATAFSIVKALVALLPSDFPRVQDIHVSAPVLLFTILVTVATGILFGMAPAFQAGSADPKEGLQKGGRTSTGTGRQSHLRNALVVAEVSLACVLLIGAGLMLRSLLNQLRLDPGFQRVHILTASLSLPRAVYKGDEPVGRFTDQLAANLNTLPGVESAGLGTDLPWTGYDENAGGFTIEGKKPPAGGEDFHARYHMATPGYFSALGTPLLAGRFFTEADNREAPRTAVINHAMAAMYWPGENPVGKRMTFDDHPKSDKDWITIVGVVGDVKDQPNSPEAKNAFWLPMLQTVWSSDVSVVIRARSDPTLLADALRNEVHRLDPSLAVSDVQVMDRIVDKSVETPRFAFVLVGMFAGLAILLAAIGIYGVIAYSVSQRTPEFGLRMALGAQQGNVMRLVLAQASKLTIAGAAIGIALSFMVVRVLRSLIFQVSPNDPVTFSAVGFGVIGVALVACYIPARAATKADPMEALRAE